MMNESLIYTVKGNLPISSLQYETEWIDSEDSIKFVERYLLLGEVVKESAHVYIKKGIASSIEQGIFV